ncbi:hypothetical protein GJAV_G00075220 [Gymnothorax javanicus]|nr:hypothetical protein GJAV_G00075220 [Gymnothorax javanicus]
MANGTTTGSPPTEHQKSVPVLGLAVGLPLALVTVAVAVIVICTRRARSANISQTTDLKTTDDSAHNAANPRYVASVVRPPPTQRDPVYQNFQSQGPVPAQSRQNNAASTRTHRKIPPAEDLYMQCDPQEDAIYNNDPSFFNCPKQPDHSHEDEYIMPDMQ